MAETKKGLYRLKAGGFEAGGRVWTSNDPNNNIVESEHNLLELYPGKFERAEAGATPSAGVVNDAAKLYPPEGQLGSQEQQNAAKPAFDNPRGSGQPGQVLQTGEPPAPNAENAATAEDSELAAVDDGLEEMTVAELEELADKKKIDLAGAHLKADKIEKIRAGQRNKR